MKWNLPRGASLARLITPLRLSLLITATSCVFLFLSSRQILRERVSILKFFEYRIYDYLMNLRGAHPPGKEVVIVAIDEKTLDEIGRWPFNRRYFARLLKILNEARAKVIAFDIVFSEPDQNSELLKLRELLKRMKELGFGEVPEEFEGLRKVGERLKQRIAEVRDEIARLTGGGKKLSPPLLKKLSTLEKELTSLEDLQDKIQNLLVREQRFYAEVKEAETQADSDQILARALAETEGAILGYFFYTGREGETYPEKERDAREERILPSRITLVRYPPEVSSFVGGVEMTLIEPNIAVLSEAGRHFGYFYARPDLDGIYRWYPLVARYKDHFYPSLALLSASLYLGKPIVVDLLNPWVIDSVRIGRSAIPVDEEGKLLLNYRGGPKTFPHYSFSDVVLGRVPGETFRDKIVLVGATAIGIMDIRATPFSEVYPGVEIHATAIDNLLKGDFYRKPRVFILMDFLALIALGLILGIILKPLRAVATVFVTLGVVGGYILLGYLLITRMGIWITMAFPILNAFFVFAGVLVLKYFTEERQRRQIRSAFQYYLSPAVVEEVIRDPSRLKLGGEKKVLTVLFSDVRGFTTISETLDPQDLVQLLNEYLTPMTEIVFQNGGTLDKYMGDAIMAFFGAPVDLPDHPQRACRTALMMVEKLKELQEVWKKRGVPPFDVGIGINTGPMSVGNMGSNQRFDYTVMGDAVNLGSRLEGLNKMYGTLILISQFTYDALNGSFFCREIDFVAVKGKREPVRIYELISENPIPELVPLVEGLSRALSEYRAGNFEKALELFTQLQREFPRDRPTYEFIHRCERLLHSPPQAWDGVYVAETK